MSRRLIPLCLGLLLLAAGLARADDVPYPVIGQPVLKPDSQWVQTDWGYQSTSLVFDTSRRWPAAFTMEGYSGASRPAPNVYLRMDDGELIALRITFGAGPADPGQDRGNYAFVQASIRGTECSGGHFNLYDRRHAWDGHHIIEWIASQRTWSNGRVGMFGSSFPGQTAYWTAATQPPSLKAVSANLLHSDIYRDIFMVGAVQNYLFPSLWTYATGPHRLPENSVDEGTIPEDEICTQHQAARYGAGDLPQPQNEPAWAALRGVDDDWYTGHAAITYAPAIRIPYYQQGNWQDEQVGPRAVVLFNHIHPDPVSIVDANGNGRRVIPKKFVMSNGDHGWGGYAGRQRWAFFDIFLRGMPDRTGMFDSQIVNHFEAKDDGTAVATTSGNRWPFEGTQWTRMYPHQGGSLDFARPTGDEATDTYLSGASRHGFSWESPDTGAEVTRARGLPDEVRWESAELTQQMVVAGPLSIDLYASMAGTDADFFVSVSDVFPDGRVSYLQRGLLKSSHRRVDPLRSYWDQGIMVQPYRPHTNPQPVVPGEIIKYQIEIFPMGYIFRPQHKILVQVHTPPAVDGLWGYTPSHQPAAVTLYHSAAYPTSLLLPVVQPDAPVPAGTTPCPLYGGFPCLPPSTLEVPSP
ncbi:MAG: CocE/NonD family hydrolase [Actinomycetota bacterium]